MNENIPISAFTSKSNTGISNQLIAPVTISGEDKSVSTSSLWDTGATNSCISNEVVNQLGLVATGMMDIQTPSGRSKVYTYLVSVMLPNNVLIEDVKVSGTAIGEQGIGMLIGMDIITKGDFAVSNHDGCTVFSFRVPSIKMTDYVEQHRIQNKIGKHGKGNRKRRHK